MGRASRRTRRGNAGRNARPPRVRTKPTLSEAPTSAPIPGPPYFHGGVPGLTAGELLQPASALGVSYAYRRGPSAAGPVYDPRFVYFTTSSDVATGFAARCVHPLAGEVPGSVYEVEPVGPIHEDPDYPGIGLRAREARVLRTVHTDVTLGEREQTRLEASYKTWGKGGAAMYDAEGYMLPSPQMSGHGVTAEHTRIYGPYLPWYRIDGKGQYVPSEKALGRGQGEIAAELLREVPDLDSAAHQVTHAGDFMSSGDRGPFSCRCGHQRATGEGAPPHVHQLGERIVDLLGVGLDRQQRGMLPEMLARAAAERDPARWLWFTPRVAIITGDDPAQWQWVNPSEAAARTARPR